MSEENVEIVKGIYAAWGKGDFSSAEFADPEIEYSMPGPISAVARGRDQMARAFGEFIREWRGFRCEGLDFVDAGDRVVVAQEFYGEGRSSGLPIDRTPSAAVLTLRGGKVTRFVGHRTMKGALADAGLES